MADGVERVTGPAGDGVREFVSLHADEFGSRHHEKPQPNPERDLNRQDSHTDVALNLVGTIQGAARSCANSLDKTANTKI
jgi:hypothetical protein